MGTQKVELERAGEKSAVYSSDLVCSLFILDHESSGRVTHDSHKLYTDKSDEPRDSPLHEPQRT